MACGPEFHTFLRYSYGWKSVLDLLSVNTYFAVTCLFLIDNTDLYKGSQKLKMKKNLLPNMKELLETNRMSHSSFLRWLVLWNSCLKDWIFHSAVICGTEWCKRHGLMKMRLAAYFDGYVFWDWYCCSSELTPMVLTIFSLSEIPVKSVVRILLYVLLFKQKFVLREKM